MKEDSYNSKLAVLKGKVTGWMGVALLMGVSNLLLVIFLFLLQSPEKTIVVPTEVRKSFWVQGNTVSPEYYLEMSEYFVSKLMTYNPATAEGQFAEVLKYMNPLGFTVMQGKLKSETTEIKSKQMGSAFYQEQVKIVGKKVLGYGELVSMMAGQIISTQKIGYELDFDYRDGKLFVNSFKKIAMPPTGIAGYEEALKAQPASTTPATQPTEQGGV